MEDSAEIYESIGRHVAEMPEVRTELHAVTDRVLERLGDETLGRALQIEGVDTRPPLDAIADATWPAFMAVFRSPHAQAWIDSLVDELIDEYER